MEDRTVSICLILTDSLLGLLFDPEHEGCTFLESVSEFAL